MKHEICFYADTQCEWWELVSYFSRVFRTLFEIARHKLSCIVGLNAENTHRVNTFERLEESVSGIKEKKERAYE